MRRTGDAEAYGFMTREHFLDVLWCFKMTFRPMTDYQKLVQETHTENLRKKLASSFLMQVFTALHGMQTRSSDENSVCPSVCPSVKRVHCDKM